MTSEGFYLINSITQKVGLLSAVNLPLQLVSITCPSSFAIKLLKKPSKAIQHKRKKRHTSKLV